MSINGTLRSGLTWSMESEFDLHVFNEIFVNLEYESAFIWPMGVRYDGPYQIVDLGANVGYFTLYAADFFLRHGYAFHITAIDASRSNTETMMRRFRAQPTAGLVGNVTIKQALVGMMAGQAPFEENQNHAVNGIYPDGVLMPYTPVADLIPLGSIDILKVDVEGCEQMLLECQGNIFRRSDTVIMEIHNDRVDPMACRRMLYDYGLVNHMICREAGLVSVERFTR